MSKKVFMNGYPNCLTALLLTTTYLLLTTSLYMNPLMVALGLIFTFYRSGLGHLLLVRGWSGSIALTFMTLLRDPILYGGTTHYSRGIHKWCHLFSEVLPTLSLSDLLWFFPFFMCGHLWMPLLYNSPSTPPFPIRHRCVVLHCSNVLLCFSLSSLN